MAEMTTEIIVATCKANGGYAAPHLNDQLFLHCKGFAEIKNLERYEKVKVLWLEQNAIHEIKGLENKEELVTLLLQNNTLTSLRSMALMPLRNLRVLNISHNYISSLEGLGTGCPCLETLQASHNYITSLEVCEELWLLADTLTSVDLSFNRIQSYEKPLASPTGTGADLNSIDGDTNDEVKVLLPGADAPQTDVLVTNKQTDPLVIVRFFKKLPLVSVIYMQGNTISHGLKHYRRNMVLHLSTLTYLDERPVFPEERRVVEAWGRGGEEAETAERALIRDQKKEHLNSCVRVLSDQMEANRAVRDRLTKQWQERQTLELEQLTRRRRSEKEAFSSLDVQEAAARTALEKEEQNGWWDIADEGGPALAAALAQEKAKAPLLVEELLEETAEAQEATAEAGAAEEEVVHETMAERRANAIVSELTKTDDQVLNEMEEEIQNVLESLNPYSAVRRASQEEEAATHQTEQCRLPNEKNTHADPMRLDRQTAKAERAAHTAISATADRLREESERRRQKKQALWQQFDKWEQRALDVGK